MLSLTERAVEQLIPVIDHRMKFLQAIKKLKGAVEAAKDGAEDEGDQNMESQCEPPACTSGSKDVDIQKRYSLL